MRHWWEELGPRARGAIAAARNLTQPIEEGERVKPIARLLHILAVGVFEYLDYLNAETESLRARVDKLERVVRERERGS